VVHSDLGAYNVAESLFDLALGLRATHEAPRLASGTFHNVAVLKIMNGGLDEATNWNEAARRAAQSVQSQDRLRASYLLAADIALADGHPEVAWQALEEACQRKAPVGNRLTYDRLLLMYTWATRGYKAFTDLQMKLDAWSPGQYRRDALARRAVIEWIRFSEGIEPPQSNSAFMEMRRLGLSGNLAYLSRIGIVEPGTSVPEEAV
jgi:hypothetical protein